MWKGFVGFVLALVLVGVGGYCYFGFGLAPVATAAKPMPFERFLAHKALNAAIAGKEDKPSPVDTSEPNLQAGAAIYRANCAVCHGLPGQPESNIAKGMFPKVPQLFKGTGVTDDPVGESFWKVQNGIRMTGMPAFQSSLDETQMWQVSQLVAHADKLPDSVKEALSRP
jgi:thiosulfate dehydrogenase